MSALGLGVFGEPIKSFKNAWEAAVTRAGFADLQFHDLRLSGARNLSRAGVPERVIMSITGHKTRAMFDSYNIANAEISRTTVPRRLAGARDATHTHANHVAGFVPNVLRSVRHESDHTRLMP